MSSKTFTPDELAKLDQAFLSNIDIKKDDAATTTSSTKYEVYLIVIIALLAFIIFIRLTFILVKYSMNIIGTIKGWFWKTPKETLVITK